MLKLEHMQSVWYHGTTDDCIPPLSNKNIDIHKSRKRTDFGQGFYVTSSYEQALVLAKMRADKIKEKNPAKTVKAAVLAFQLDLNFFRSLSGGRFYPVADANWAGFVYNNRKRITISKHRGKLGIYTCTEHNCTLQFCYVYGPVADGNPKFAHHMYNLEYKGVDFETFVSGIKPPKGLIDQLSFHSNAIANRALTYISEVKTDADARRIQSRFNGDSPTP